MAVFPPIIKSRRILVAVVLIAALVGWMGWWLRGPTPTKEIVHAPSAATASLPTETHQPQVAAPVVPPVVPTAISANSLTATDSATMPTATTENANAATSTDNPQQDIATAIPYFLGLMKSGDVTEQVKVFSWPGMTQEHYRYSLERLAGAGGQKLVQALVKELELIKDQPPTYNDQGDGATWDFVNEGHIYHIVWFKYQGQWYFGAM